MAEGIDERMSMNLTVHTKPCPHCGRQEVIDLRQTPTEITWRCLYYEGERGKRNQRPWQETRDIYIAWLTEEDPEDKASFINAYGDREGRKRYKQACKDNLYNCKDHIDLLMKQDWLEFSYI